MNNNFEEGDINLKDEDNDPKDEDNAFAREGENDRGAQNLEQDSDTKNQSKFDEVNIKDETDEGTESDSKKISSKKGAMIKKEEATE